MSESLENIRSRIEALEVDFQFIKTIKTSMNGVERETWLLEYEGSQFVYVAGQKNVVLGWDVDKCPLGQGLLKGLQEEFNMGHEYYQDQADEIYSEYQEEIEEAEKDGDLAKIEELKNERAQELKDQETVIAESGYKTWEDFMRIWNENLVNCLSPLRTADIGDMIVEVDNRYIEEDVQTISEAVHTLKEVLEPFTLATEDEWEYLCNGGTRTLFRWGDTLGEDNDIFSEIYNVGCVSDPHEKPLLERPNMLGLFIAYNSYKYEIIDNTQYVKGGDGGGSLCGGDGGLYVLPCYTAFYRQEPYVSAYGLSKDFYCYRRVIRLP